MSSGCHYLPDLIAVDRDNLQRAVEALRQKELTVMILFEPPPQEGDGPQEGAKSDQDYDGSADLSYLDRTTRTLVTSLVGVIRVVGGDIHDLSAALADDQGPIRAAPLHGLGRLNHISAMEGTEPATTPTPAGGTSASHYPDPYGVIAVVDSGITSNTPEWLSDGLRFDDPADIERLGGSGTSHGTFVASLIRTIAPNHVVSMARARETPVDRFKPDLESGHKAGSPVLITELDVLAAIVRLVERHAGDPVDALNLSLGGFSCGPDDSTMLVLSIALDYWRQHFPRAPVFAAGGNTDDPRPVYPGAFNLVRSVGAGGNGTGEQMTWDLTSTDRKTGKPENRPWITDIAPGANLIGLSGTGPDDWVTWSGSSFSSALATACYSSRRPMEALDDKVWWCDRRVTYDKIAGLRF